MTVASTEAPLLLLLDPPGAPARYGLDLRRHGGALLQVLADFGTLAATAPGLSAVELELVGLLWPQGKSSGQGVSFAAGTAAGALLQQADTVRLGFTLSRPLGMLSLDVFDYDVTYSGDLDVAVFLDTLALHDLAPQATLERTYQAWV